MNVENDIQQRINSGINFHDQVPDLPLQPDERVIDVQNFDFQLPDKHLSALKAVMDLTDASTAAEIGMNGPSNAANATEANKNNSELKLFEAFFPRDSYTTADFINYQFPKLTFATIRESLKYSGVRENLRSTGLKDEQENWKTPHEVRSDSDPIAKKLTEEKDWGWPYYGAIDTTGKSIKAITRVCLDSFPANVDFLFETYQGLDDRTHTIGEALHGQINWIRKRQDFNKEGVVEALWMNPKHHANQTWADSTYAFHHADGSWPLHHPEKNWGVAPVELQAETYDALVGTMELYKKLEGNAHSSEQRHFLQDEIADLGQRAAQLREVVLEKFWVEDEDHFGGYFAKATDRDDEGNLRPMAVRSSDMGHLLNSGILDGDEPNVAFKRKAVIRNLFSAEMLCPSGIRTISSDSVRYYKDKYHAGTSWPWVTYFIASGLDKHGYHGLSYELKKRAWSLYNETKILPEYGTGSDDPKDRLVNKKVTIYDPTAPEKIHGVGQPPQEIQAWTAAAILAMKYEHGDRLFRPDEAIPTQAVNNDKRQLEEQILATLS